MKTKKNLALASSQINNYINLDSTLNTISQINHLPQTIFTIPVGDEDLGGWAPTPKKQIRK